jgi:hypothetical protein
METAMNTPEKTYARELVTAMIAYAVLLVAMLLALPYLAGSVWRFGLVLLPVVPAALIVRAVMRYLAHMDELQQRIQLMGISFAAAATALITFAYGFLQLAGVPALNWLWVFPLMFLLWWLGITLAARRYQ